MLSLFISLAVSHSLFVSRTISHAATRLILGKSVPEQKSFFLSHDLTQDVL